MHAVFLKAVCGAGIPVKTGRLFFARCVSKSGGAGDLLPKRTAGKFGRRLCAADKAARADFPCRAGRRRENRTALFSPSRGRLHRQAAETSAQRKDKGCPLRERRRANSPRAGDLPSLMLFYIFKKLIYIKYKTGVPSRRGQSRCTQKSTGARVRAGPANTERPCSAQAKGLRESA